MLNIIELSGNKLIFVMRCVIMLSVIMLSVVILSVVMLSTVHQFAITLRVGVLISVILSVIMSLCVVTLSVGDLNVVPPPRHFPCKNSI